MHGRAVGRAHVAHGVAAVRLVAADTALGAALTFLAGGVRLVAGNALTSTLITNIAIPIS